MTNNQPLTLFKYLNKYSIQLRLALLLWVSSPIHWLTASTFARCFTPGSCASLRSPCQSVPCTVSGTCCWRMPTAQPRTPRSRTRRPNRHDTHSLTWPLEERWRWGLVGLVYTLKKFTCWTQKMEVWFRWCFFFQLGDFLGSLLVLLLLWVGGRFRLWSQDVILMFWRFGGRKKIHVRLLRGVRWNRMHRWWNRCKKTTEGWQKKVEKYFGTG